MWSEAKTDQNRKRTEVIKTIKSRKSRKARNEKSEESQESKESEKNLFAFHQSDVELRVTSLVGFRQAHECGIILSYYFLIG
jgi:hypothetical protein